MDMSEDKPITFDAIIYKVQTLVDHGIRLTLDLPENAIVAAAQMMALKRTAAILHIEIIPEIQSVTEVNEDKERGEISARAIRKSERATT